MIKSISNEYFKKLCKLNNKRYRDETLKSFDVLIEGERLITQTIDFGVNIKSLYVRIDRLDQYDRLISKANCPVSLLSIKQSDILSETCSEQGIFARVENVSQASSLCIENSTLETRKPLLYLNNISDPGILGTIIRTASAFGIDGLILDKDCCDISNSKLIRASMGSVFSVPILRASESWLSTRHEQIFVCDAQNGVSLDKFSFPNSPYIVVLGSEAHGISDYIANLSHSKIKIPMIGKMQSLNVSVAAGIIMHQMKRSSEA